MLLVARPIHGRIEERHTRHERRYSKKTIAKGDAETHDDGRPKASEGTQVRVEETRGLESDGETGDG